MHRINHSISSMMQQIFTNQYSPVKPQRSLATGLSNLGRSTSSPHSYVVRRVLASRTPVVRLHDLSLLCCSICCYRIYPVRQATISAMISGHQLFLWFFIQIILFLVWCVACFLTCIKKSKNKLYRHGWISSNDDIIILLTFTIHNWSSHYLTKTKIFMFDRRVKSIANIFPFNIVCMRGWI